MSFSRALLGTISGGIRVFVNSLTIIQLVASVRVTQLKTPRMTSINDFFNIDWSRARPKGKF